MKIQNAFAKMMEGRTSFIVAHRLSTIQEADIILVMKDGHILEQGSPQDVFEHPREERTKQFLSRFKQG